MLQSNLRINITKRMAISLVLFGSVVFAVYGQGKILEIDVPDYVVLISQPSIGNDGERTHRFIVHLTNDGIIDSFKLQNRNESSELYKFDISLGPSFVSIQNGQGRTTNLTWGANTVTITRKSNSAEDNVEELQIAPKNGTLYASTSKTLMLTNGNLEERANKEPYEGQLFSYSGLVTAERYRVFDNINSKMKYRQRTGKIEIFFSYNNDGEFDFSSEPIIFQGGSIHSNDQRINIVNYLVLRQIGVPFAEMFFPLVFLGDSMWKY